MIVIPARKGSKGFPGKSRRLCKYTFDTIPESKRPNTVVDSDDDKILKIAKNEYGFICNKRDKELANDTASVKDVIRKTLWGFPGCLDGIVIMLYLTYYKRTWEDVERAWKFFVDNNAKSLLCKTEAKSHPYLCMYEYPENRGQQIVPHGMWRRQDYPKVFQISHYISIFRVDELENLNHNLYNQDTVFFPIGDVVDVDYEKDFLESK